MPNLTSNGMTLHYADRGEGAPVLFLNGLAGDHLYWMGQIRVFAKRFRCLALDNRDAGQSTYAASSYTMRDLAEDTAGLLRGLNLPPTHVVGLSLGGMIAQELALQYPYLVRSLFLVGTVGRCDAWFADTLTAYGHIRRQVADTSAFFQVLLPWLVSHQFYRDGEKVEWLRAILKQNPYPQKIEGFFRQFEAIRGFDALDRLPALKCPVLVAAGEHDRIAPPRYAQQISGKLPQARLEILPDIGHAPPIEDPRNFNRLLEEFLS